MKYLFLVIFGFLSFSGFSQNYFLADENSDKTALAEFIHQSITDKKLSRDPVLVVNERVLKKDELDNLNFYKSDILHISVIAKDNPQMTEIYGQQSLNGVVLIETKPFQERAAKSTSNNKVLYLLDNEPITQEELEKLHPEKIESVTVIKDKKEMARYTADQYDGIILIQMKKSE